MRSVTIAVLIATSVATAVHAAPKPCSVSAAVLDVYRHPLTATSAEWGSARKVMNDLMIAPCVLEGRSRALVFSVLEKEMSLDYAPVFETWQKRNGKPLSEGAFEGVLFFQRDLLAYIDRIVSPSDLQYRDVILEYADGLAISKLGRAAKDRVIQQSGMRPKALHGLGQLNRQEEAFRAIGYWLDPADATLTAAEKLQHSVELTVLLPADGRLHGDLHSRMVTTVVEALGHSDETRVAEKIRAWRHTYENVNGTGDSISDLAQNAADKIVSKAAAKAKNRS